MAGHNLETLSRRDRTLRRRVDDLRTSPRLHHVADLATGAVSSERAPAVLSNSFRRQRLVRLGHRLDLSIFGKPDYRISSRRPYQESPRAWIHASSPAFYLTEVEFIAWSQARNPGTNRGFMVFHFDQPPEGKCLATFSISASPHAGTTGRVTLRGPGEDVSIPITGPFNHTVESVFTAPGGPVEVGFILEAGIQTFTFFEMTLGTAPLVLQP